jgi:DNA-binding winged helix-turn-helix (wHTH) protein/ATP/maltotriose-dependent transcriptional regulator MalT
MGLRFGRFELDDEGRALRLDGREQPVQPLVFDLLVYLVHARARVVPKQELLMKLWAGVTVTDGSLQRAVSLLRSVLREGGLTDAVQTHARRGYRFNARVDVGEAAAPPSLRGPPPARALANANQFDDALTAFEQQAKSSSMSADDWEAWGNAALCAGKPELAVVPLERAVAAFETAGELESAARVALVLCNVKVEGRDLAVAAGWHTRALSYLENQVECKEHGMAEWLASRMALFRGELDESGRRARIAMDIAKRVDDPDLHCLGLVYHGHILLAQGEVQRGLIAHDEAGAAALAGRSGPWVSGIVFCSVIWAYLHLGDHHRASQWTDEFARWCQRYASYCYPALCRLHRGEVLANRGELQSAEVEVRRAREELTQVGPYCEGDACRVLGEIRLSLGDVDGAEAAFRDSHLLGWNPQPGLSLLLAERGQLPAALKQLERALSQPGWADGQRRATLLAVLARLAAQAGHRERSRAALRDFDTIPEPTLGSKAERCRARAELAAAEGDLSHAELALRESIAHWLALGARVHAAHARLRLCALLLQSDDPVAAELELSAAESVFASVGAEPLIERCRALRKSSLA